MFCFTENIKNDFILMEHQKQSKLPSSTSSDDLEAKIITHPEDNDQQTSENSQERKKNVEHGSLSCDHPQLENPHGFQKLPFHNFKGLLLIENFRNMTFDTRTEQSIIYKGFWKEPEEKIQSNVNTVLSYAKVIASIAYFNILLIAFHFFRSFKVFQTNIFFQKFNILI